MPAGVLLFDMLSIRIGAAAAAAAAAVREVLTSLLVANREAVSFACLVGRLLVSVHKKTAYRAISDHSASEFGYR